MGMIVIFLLALCGFIQSRFCPQYLEMLPCEIVYQRIGQRGYIPIEILLAPFLDVILLNCVHGCVDVPMEEAILRQKFVSVSFKVGEW